MQLPRRYRARAAAAAALALLAAACTDRSQPAGPTGPDGEGPGTGPGDPPVTIRTLACTGDVRTRRVSCDEQQPSTGEAAGDIILGHQDDVVKLASSNVNYDAGTTAFTFEVTVRNLIPQPLGTTDGTTLSPNGVKVVFVEDPHPTPSGGSGTITVVPDGSATFPDLAEVDRPSRFPGSSTTPRPYYQYNSVLDQFEVSPPKTWQFNIPNTVTTFEFVVVVLTPVPFPRGYVDIVGTNFVRSANNRQLTGIVRDSVGRAMPSTPARAITWATTTPTLASVNSSGLVHGLRAGAAEITGDAQIHPGVPVTGSFDITVRPIRRYWTGAAGTTDWFDGNNWAAATKTDSIVPVATDTAVVADTITPPAANYPVLTANADIGGVEVEKESINLAAFNLTASGDVFTDLIDNAEITSSSGRLNLTGIGRTIRGRVTRTQVEGTYSLNGNLNVRAPLTVLRGRLTNQSFRVQVQSF
ncbi:MAG TPA: hypothetical protein VHG91_08605 [Longimicrobium sp.]|nr:hypothetical protein [Longimicrobium sp.]